MVVEIFFVLRTRAPNTNQEIFLSLTPACTRRWCTSRWRLSASYSGTYSAYGRLWPPMTAYGRICTKNQGDYRCLLMFLQREMRWPWPSLPLTTSSFFLSSYLNFFFTLWIPHLSFTVLRCLETNCKGPNPPNTKPPGPLGLVPE